MQLCQNFCSKVQSEGKGPKADISQQYDLHNIDCLLIWYILSILWTHLNLWDQFSHVLFLNYKDVNSSVRGTLK